MKNKIVSLSKVRPIRYIIAGGFAYVVEILACGWHFNIFSLNISLECDYWLLVWVSNSLFFGKNYLFFQINQK